MSSEILAQLAAALAGGKVRVVDLSQTLKPSTPVIQLPAEFAPSSPFRIEEISHYDQRGPGWYWNNISLRRAYRDPFRCAGALGHRQGFCRRVHRYACRCSGSWRRLV